MSMHVVIEVTKSVLDAAPIFVILMGPLMLGTIALLVAPLLFAATLPLSSWFAVVVAQSLMAFIPMFMLRQRVLPDSFVAWMGGLPVPHRLNFMGDAWATTVLMAPLLGAYLLSSLVWLWQWPAWLRPVGASAFATVLVSALGTWWLGMMMMAMRRNSCGESGRGAVSTLQGDTRLAWIALVSSWSRDVVLTHCLLLAPMWRCQSVVLRAGQSTFIALAGGCLAGMQLLSPGAGTWQPALPPLAAVLYVAVTHWRDAAIQAKLAHLEQVTAGWPISLARLSLVAKVWAAVPAAGLSLLPMLLIPFSDTSKYKVVAVLWFSVIGLVGTSFMLFATAPESRARWSAVAVLMAALVICGGIV